MARNLLARRTRDGGVIVQVEIDEDATAQHDRSDNRGNPRRHASANNPKGRVEHLDIRPGKPKATDEPYDDDAGQRDNRRPRLLVRLPHFVAIAPD